MKENFAMSVKNASHTSWNSQFGNKEDGSMRIMNEYWAVDVKITWSIIGNVHIANNENVDMRSIQNEIHPEEKCKFYS